MWGLGMLQFIVIVYLLIFIYLHYFVVNKTANNNSSNKSKSKSNKRKSNKSNKSNNTTKAIKITFYTKKQTRQFILEDADKFIATLDQANCFARNVHTTNEYVHNSAQAASTFSQTEQKQLRRAVYLATDALTSKMSAKDLRQYGVDLSLLRPMLASWSFAKTSAKNVEMGMPHTRQQIIFLSGNFMDKYSSNVAKLTRTLIHESLHLYQRANAPAYNAFLRKYDWVPYPYNRNDLRINPDLDKTVWKKDKRIYYAKFTTLTPLSLKDVVLSHPKYEHPYEWYAYALGEALVPTPPSSLFPLPLKLTRKRTNGAQQKPQSPR